MPDNAIDDQDASHVKYTGSWVVGGTSREYGGTVASSTVVGDYFTVSFHGNSIVVFGTIDSSSAGVQTSYSVDGSTAEVATSAAGAADTYKQQFWKSSILPTGDHTLKVTMVMINQNPTPNEGTIWFDYFQITDPTPATSTTTTGIAPVTSIIVTSIISGAPASVTSGDTSTIVQGSSTSIGAVVGGVLGALAVLALVFLFLFCRKRRRRERKAPLPIHNPQYNPAPDQGQAFTQMAQSQVGFYPYGHGYQNSPSTGSPQNYPYNPSMPFGVPQTGAPPLPIAGYQTAPLNLAGYQYQPTPLASNHYHEAPLSSYEVQPRPLVSSIERSQPQHRSSRLSLQDGTDINSFPGGPRDAQISSTSTSPVLAPATPKVKSSPIVADDSPVLHTDSGVRNLKPSLLVPNHPTELPPVYTAV